MRARMALATTVAVVGAGTAMGVGTVPAGAVGTLTLQATFTSVSYGWSQVERYNDTDPNWPSGGYYPSDGRNNQTGQRATFFGSSQPLGSQFLLYYAPGWNTGSKAVPVLLVMGAADNVDREYADPALNGAGTCGASSCPSTGLMQYLSGAGYRVFAVDFSNIQGDNYQQAQTISDAIQVIKSKTGQSQVDVVAWSKGAFPARMYVAGVRPSWGRAYQNDVRKLIMLGGPQGGLDYVFAHGAPGNILIYPECGGSQDGPSAHIQYECYGVFYSHPELSIDNDGGYNTYLGQRQMLARWDGTYGVDQSTQDWYTTYYGGQGYTSYGYGIVTAMNEGSLVATVQGSPIPTAVTTDLLCGGSANMPGFYNENRGPSDGLVFLASCESTTGIPGTHNITEVAGDNHLMLGWESSAESQVESWLG
ncbi:MAG TPA: lipase [Candidatus Dormibacteraeota bacterium]|nr:lipase [Candidatus Dormibacteraeota bacterium]